MHAKLKLHTLFYYHLRLKAVFLLNIKKKIIRQFCLKNMHFCITCRYFRYRQHIFVAIILNLENIFHLIIKVYGGNDK